MASSSSPGLKDILIPTPTSEKFPITKTLTGLVSSSTSSPSHFDVAQEFEKLSVESHVKLSPQGSSSSPPSSPSLSVYMLPTMEITETLEENLCKRKVEYENPDGNEIYLKRDLEKKQLNGKKCFPPPIPCLRKVKVGKPFKYLTYDKESESYAYDEEIKIPNGSLFHASREDGRLKLYMHFSDEED